MKKISLTFTLILSMILILSACQEGEQEQGSQVSEPETEKLNDEVVPEKQNDKEKDEENSEFHTEVPSVKKINSDGLNTVLDNSYLEICWNDCDDNRAYNYPEIHSGDVEVGDRILIDWRTMKPTPSKVNLIHVNNHVNSSGEEISKEDINNKHSTLNIQVGEEEIGKQYAVQFIWKDGEKLTGRSVLNYKLK